VGKQWTFNDDWFVGSVFKGGYNSGAVFKMSEFDAVSELYSKTLKYVSPEMTGWQFGGFYATKDDSSKNTHGQIFQAQQNTQPIKCCWVLHTKTTKLKIPVIIIA
jgi:predicted porin